jgi:4-deoxy-L-threo-5-hexosulose-uronate ketol-isomerase
MKIKLMADSVRYPHMTSRELRETFLMEALFSPGEIRVTYLDLDRAVVGMATPLETALSLAPDPDLRAKYFLERREVGVLNIGGRGNVRIDGKEYAIDNLDCLYVGRGNAEVQFESDDPANPAIFYLLSYPAHQGYPVTLVRREDASPMELGSTENSNHRVVYKYIHLQGAKSCQLVMGVTHLQSGSVWNTMPPHTHMRRSEIYMYFNLNNHDRVFHLMGPPEETRHLVLSNRQVVVSPGWSIHAGAGSSAYSFCWGMGGENQDYTDMDVVSVDNLH